MKTFTDLLGEIEKVPNHHFYLELACENFLYPNAYALLYDQNKVNEKLVIPDRDVHYLSIELPFAINNSPHPGSYIFTCSYDERNYRIWQFFSFLHDNAIDLEAYQELLDYTNFKKISLSPSLQPKLTREFLDFIAQNIDWKTSQGIEHFKQIYPILCEEEVIKIIHGSYLKDNYGKQKQCLEELQQYFPQLLSNKSVLRELKLALNHKDNIHDYLLGCEERSYYSCKLTLDKAIFSPHITLYKSHGRRWLEHLEAFLKEAIGIHHIKENHDKGAKISFTIFSRHQLPVKEIQTLVLNGLVQLLTYNDEDKSYLNSYWQKMNLEKTLSQPQAVGKKPKL